MSALLILLPLGLGLLAVALAAFLWAVRNGQLENLDHEGTRILFDDGPGEAHAKNARHEESGPGDAPRSEEGSQS